MNNNRTVSDTKRAFYSLHTRPIHSIYRRVVEELMVEMHLLTVNVDFRYDPIFAFGVVTTFNRFMQGYSPEPDQVSIFNSLCQALESDPEQYQRDANRLQELTSRVSSDQIISWLDFSINLPEFDDLQQILRGISASSFKYSRLFAIGLFSLLEKAAPELIKDTQWRKEALEKVCQSLNLPLDKVNKDLDLYRSNLEKMTQARVVLEDVIKADRKKREQAQLS